jgi:phospholipid-binding lipoprotein MlaA
MKIKTILFLFILILLQGCSNKKIDVPLGISHVDNNQTLISTQNNTDVDETVDNEEFDTDDFADEYSNENEIKDDPFSGYNRLMTMVNDKLFIYVINPISKGYAYLFPEAIRIGVSNAIHNIEFPIRFTNNLMQGKFQNSSDELERFIINSTLGVAGLFDIATTYKHIPAHNEDFGQTLGYYGVGAGYHIVLPLLGPSNIRDIVGLTIDGYTSPLIYESELEDYKIPNDYLESTGIYSLKMINKNALNLGAYENLKKDSMDLYPFLRDIYEQKRISDIEE